jgi:uncharacterized repeat protein (TIGR03803 family)
MRHFSLLFWIVRCALALSFFLTMAAQCGVTLEVLSPLRINSADSYYPTSAMIQASDGAFYGTTKLGGSNGIGTIFRVTKEGARTNLLHFNDTNGYYPSAPLVQTWDGKMYGTTYFGGAYRNGTIFSITTNGIFNTVFSFSLNTGAAWPESTLLEASDGRLYGTTTVEGLYLGWIPMECFQRSHTSNKQMAAHLMVHWFSLRMAVCVGYARTVEKMTKAQSSN